MGPNLYYFRAELRYCILSFIVIIELGIYEYCLVVLGRNGEIFPNFDFRHFNISHYDKKRESNQIARAYFLVQLATKMGND